MVCGPMQGMSSAYHVFAATLTATAHHFSSEYATAGEASVGTLESFDRRGDPVFDDDDLADLRRVTSLRCDSRKQLFVCSAESFGPA